MPAITEATLEMHFHAALMGLFRDTFGLGKTGKIEFFKYSPQLEKFVGFDQAYVQTEMSEAELFAELQEAATGSSYKLKRVLVGYFLQFKVVKQLTKKSQAMPTGFTTPYYRVAIETQRKVANDPSQWAAAGFEDTLLRWNLKPEVGYGNETAVQPGVQA